MEKGQLSGCLAVWLAKPAEAVEADYSYWRSVVTCRRSAQLPPPPFPPTKTSWTLMKLRQEPLA